MMNYKLMSLLAIVFLFSGSFVVAETSPEKKEQIKRSQKKVAQSGSILQTLVPVGFLAGYVYQGGLIPLLGNCWDKIMKQGEAASTFDCDNSSTATIKVGFFCFPPCVGVAFKTMRLDELATFVKGKVKGNEKEAYLAVAAMTIWATNKYYQRKAVKAVNTQNLFDEDED